MTKKRKPFKFANYIADKSDFLINVEKIWKEQIHGHHMFQLVKKLKMPKKNLRHLNWRNGNVFERVNFLREGLKKAQLEVNLFPHDNNKKHMAASILEEYLEAKDDEEKLLFQCAKVEWLNEGDRNFAYFHKHFNNFLEKSSKVDHVDSLGNIFSTILGIDDANVMVKEVSNIEIKNAMLVLVIAKLLDLMILLLVSLRKPSPLCGRMSVLQLKTSFQMGSSLGKSITCCNVIYKCISKILTNRIKGGLDKLINLNQSAFIQGRSIQDNILLTQELLNGYNRKSGPKRCSLKIDIAKAYDTVSWDFLRNILIKFGFHVKMMDWIFTCVSSSNFSVCLNGEVYRYFQGGRGLRQGEPISPYLFTLVMEVFTLIVDHKIRNSDDFKYHVGCKDLKLTRLCFADDLLVLCHGDKGSIKIIKDSIDDFSKVSGLVPNLNKSIIFFGNVNLGTQRSILNIVHFKVGVFPVKYLGVPLLTKRLRKDDCKHIVDKVKIFLLPKSTVKDIEKVLKGFLWCQGFRKEARKHIEYKIGNGELISVWHDKWCEIGPLSQFITNRDIYDTRFNNNAYLADMINNNKWKWHNEWKDVFPGFITIPVPTCINHKDKHPKIGWRSLVWFSQNIPSHAFVVWMAIQKRLMTQDIIYQWNNDNSMGCSLCRSFMDSHDHLFFQCSFSYEIWNIVKDKSYNDNLKSNWDDFVRSIALFNKKAIKDIVRRLVFGAMVYYIWQERNKRQFTNERRSAKIIDGVILENVKLRLMSLNVLNSDNVQRVATYWGIHFKIKGGKDKLQGL
ncbi:RNA-directed DNA polymerase, eukaryota, reverse transcriptase zinc-binding domain protein [Tanacetum coccineum]